ncbi:hypothetical protein KQX64_17770 [Rhodopseudomonas palustris]|nr:hypothetical protein KQX64_17770 [Rhodopseudomonas palustris]
MFRRFTRRCGRLPLFRLGLALILIGQLVDGLDALMGLDLAAILPAGWDPAKVMGYIGLTKIALRGIFVVGTALHQQRAPPDTN